MKTPKIIDEDMAQRFSANCESILGYFEEITDAAAESLSRYEGEVLNLSGLTSLTDAAAKSLSKHKGRFLGLCGLTSLTDAAAKSLSKHKRILELSDELADLL